MLPFKLKSFSVFYTKKLEFAFTECPCIACWASSIFLKENGWLRTVKIYKIGQQIMIFTIFFFFFYEYDIHNKKMNNIKKNKLHTT